MDNDHPQIAVNNDFVAIGQPFKDPAHADHGGDLHGACQDRGMGSRTARFDGKADHVGAVQSCRVRWGQILGNDNDRTGERSHIFPVGQTIQIGEDPVCHILDVCRAFPEILVRHTGHGRDIMFNGLAESTSCGQQFFADHIDHFCAEHAIVHDEQVGIEDCSIPFFQGVTES